jgi:thiamine transporter ThiT
LTTPAPYSATTSVLSYGFSIALQAGLILALLQLLRRVFVLPAAILIAYLIATLPLLRSDAITVLVFWGAIVSLQKRARER